MQRKFHCRIFVKGWTLICFLFKCNVIKCSRNPLNYLYLSSDILRREKYHPPPPPHHKEYFVVQTGQDAVLIFVCMVYVLYGCIGLERLSCMNKKLCLCLKNPESGNFNQQGGRCGQKNQNPVITHTMFAAYSPYTMIQLLVRPPKYSLPSTVGNLIFGFCANCSFFDKKGIALSLFLKERISLFNDESDLLLSFALVALLKRAT